MENLSIPQATYFNRHESMDSETRHRVLDLISDIRIIENCNTFNVENMLYGLFDGYDYSELIESDKLIQQFKDGGNSGLVDEIFAITAIVKSYPRTKEPNNNNF